MPDNHVNMREGCGKMGAGIILSFQMAVNVNLAPYSADPTGMADATAAIQQAITDCSSGGAKPGQRIDLDGVYKITGTGLRIASNGCHMRGAGPGTVLMHVGPAAGVGTINSGISTLVTQVRLEDMAMNGGDGGPIACYGGIAVSSGGVRRLQVFRCRITGYNGAAIRAAGTIDRGRFIDCEFDNINTSSLSANSSGSGFSGSFINSQIIDCEFHDTGCPINNGGPSHCVYFNNNVFNNVVENCIFSNIIGTNGAAVITSTIGQATNGVNVTVKNCTFKDMNCSAIQGVDTTGISIIGNQIYSQDGSGGIGVTYNCKGYVIAGNQIYSKGNTTGQLASIVLAADNHDGIICDNIIYNDDGNITGQYAIGMTAADGAIIRNNVIFGYCMGVEIYSVSQPGYPMKNITIASNRISAPSGAARYFPHGAVLIAPYGAACAGVAVNGICDNVRIFDNLMQNMDAELAFTNGSGGVGIPTNLLFRSPYVDGDNPGVLVCPSYPEYPRLPAGMKVLANVLSRTQPFQYSIPLADIPLPFQSSSIKGVPMESDLLIYFPGRMRYSYSFVQGEDRLMEINVFDKTTGKMFDVTGAIATLHLPRSGGGSLKRYSGSLRVLPLQVTPAIPPSPGIITMIAHGLVNGDIFTMAAASGGTLPGGVSASTNYLIKFLTEDAFSIQTMAGADVILSSVGAVGFDITLADGVIIGNASGGLVFTLSSAFTKGVQAGAGQGIQLDLIVSGKRRSIQQQAALTVFVPIDP